MKSLLILVLVLLLAGAAFFTRPSEPSFEHLVQRKISHDLGGGTVGRVAGELAGSAVADRFRYEDHYLWVTVSQDGKTRYIGAFAHWFSRKGDSR